MNVKRIFQIAIPLALALVIGAAFFSTQRDSGFKESAPGDEYSSATLDKMDRIYDLAVDPDDPGRVLFTTYGGLHSAGKDGTVRMNKQVKLEFLTFAFSPKKKGAIFAGGIDNEKKPVGLLRSDDGGITFQAVQGAMANANVYHVLETDPASGALYGVTGNGISMSPDGGKTWSHLGSPPGKVFDLAVSRTMKNTLYAATMKGLFVSRDGGMKWEKTHFSDQPAAAVTVADDGQVYAFIVRTGFVKADEPSLLWTTVATDFQGRVLIRLATSAENKGAIYAITDTSIVMISKNGGADWESFEGSDWATPDRIAAGKAIFTENCQECHGLNGAGEPKENTPAGEAPAPALDDSAHAWHHSNQNLIETIMEGSQQKGSRMIGWKDTLSPTDAQDVLAYIKSLWSFRSTACQGSRHMACMR